MNQLPAIKDSSLLTLQILHGLIALWGLADCFFGLSIFKISVRFLMALAFAVGGAALVSNFMHGSVVLMIAAGVVGLVLGFLIGWHVYKAAIVIAAVLAVFVLVQPLSASTGPALSFLLPCAAGIVAGILAYLIMEPAIILSTALTGAFRLVFGVAFFLGGPSLLDYVNGHRPLAALFAGDGRLFCLATVVCAALGCWAQFAAHARRSPRSDEEE